MTLRSTSNVSTTVMVDLLAAGPVADDDLHLESAQEAGVPDFEAVGAVFDLNQKSFLFS